MTTTTSLALTGAVVLAATSTHLSSETGFQAECKLQRDLEVSSGTELTYQGRFKLNSIYLSDRAHLTVAAAALDDHRVYFNLRGTSVLTITGERECDGITLYAQDRAELNALGLTAIKRLEVSMKDQAQIRVKSTADTSMYTRCRSQYPLCLE